MKLTCRKQKCGGVTETATCAACRTREVTCSFEMEARDPRFNPYLRIQGLVSSRGDESDMRTTMAKITAFSPPLPAASVPHGGHGRDGNPQWVTAAS